MWTEIKLELKVSTEMIIFSKKFNNVKIVSVCYNHIVVAYSSTKAE